VLHRTDLLVFADKRDDSVLPFRRVIVVERTMIGAFNTPKFLRLYGLVKYLFAMLYRDNLGTLALVLLLPFGT